MIDFALIKSSLKIIILKMMIEENFKLLKEILTYHIDMKWNKLKNIVDIILKVFFLINIF